MSRTVFAMTVLISVFLVACVDDSFQREDLQSFLTDYDPSLKTRRDELVATLASLNANLLELNSLERSYRHEQAKMFVQQKIRETEAQKQNITAVLRQLDSQIEVAMANRQIDAVNSGGIETREISGLLKESGRTIEDANEVRRDVESLFNGRFDEGESVSSPAGGQSSSAPTNSPRPGPKPERGNTIQVGGRAFHLSERFDVLMFPSSGQVYHDVVVTRVDVTSIHVRHRNGLATIGVGDLAGARLGGGSGGGVDPGVKSAEVRSSTGWAILFASPSRSERTVRRVYAGERVLVAPPGSPSGWRQVLTPEGARGWMPESFLNF